MSEYMWSDDEDQPKDHVNDGDAGKQSRDPTLDVIENGQEPEMFIVENLLLTWRRCCHGEEITTISSNGLVQSQPVRKTGIGGQVIRADGSRQVVLVWI